MFLAELILVFMQKLDADAIVFDKGNTLLMDPFDAVMELKAEEFGDICRSYKMYILGSELAEYWTLANKEINYPFAGHFTQEEPIIQEALSKLGRDFGFPRKQTAFIAPELLIAYRVGVEEVIRKDPRTAEVRQTLQELRERGHILGVFSNDRIAGLDMELAWMGLDGMFEYAETSESTGFEKPDPGVYRHILAHFQLLPERVAYVGDDPVRDIEAAKKAGLKAVLCAVDARKYFARCRKNRG